MASKLSDPATWPALGSLLAAQIAAASVAIRSAVRLPGGAVQENWRIEAVTAGGPHAGPCTWVLRTDAAARLPVSLDRNAEAQVLHAAFAAGVKVAEPIAEGAADSPLGQPFILQKWLDGTALGRSLTRDPQLASHGPGIAAALAAELARIHAVTPSSQALACLPVSMQPPARAEISRLRTVLDKAGDSRPALEYVLAWLDETAPPARALCLVHGDFRTGNYMVHQGRLTGILDWEFAHWGDPDEDLGWFTARCWRFGCDEMVAGGIAPLDAFLAAYQTASGRHVSPDALRYWQILAAAKWAAIAVLQGDRLRLGGERRLELALTGLMPAGMEHDALGEIIAWISSKPGGKGGPTWQ
jgi:aminoglycoside phosphotransferase (APT) family kinase protein